MADLKNSRNTQLNTSTIRLVSNQKAVTVTSPDLLVNYDSTGTLVPSQTLEITAVKSNTVAPVVWSTSNTNVKLYTAATGTTEVTSDPSVSGTSTVYLRASEFNAESLSSLTVTATVTDIDVASGFVTFIKLQASPGSSTFTASLYLQNASYPVGTPPAAPVGGTFNFATGVLTAPTGTPQWTATQPETSTTPTWACEYNFTGTSTQTVTAGTWQNVRIDTVTGAAGTRTAILDLYRWSSTVPTTFPSATFGVSTYTWSTAQFTLKSGTYNSWTTTPSAAVLGQTLYILRQVYADTGSSLTSDVTWTSTTPLPIAVSGVNGTRTGVLEVYKWSPTQPTSLFPTGTSTYTWATGVFTLPATPNDWSLLPGASVAGSTLWAVQVTIANTSTTSTNTVTWPATPTAYAVGAAGVGGTSKNRVELYWQTATAPAVPTNTRYTFSTNTVEVIPGSGGSLGSWLRTLPQSTTTATWMTSCQFSVVSPADQHDSSAWSTPVVYAQTGSNGLNGTKTWPVNAFLWAQTPPTIPSLDVTFTWSDKSVSAYPIAVAASGGIPAIYWTSSAPGAPGNGYTLYQITFTVTADVEAATTNFNWSSATRSSVGYRVDGTIGPTGDSARVAYTVTTSSTVPGAVTPGGGDVVPTSPGTWSFSATSTLTAGQYMYQVDGILSRTTGNITWGNPYLSNLKVGTLSAITANVGNLTIAEQGNIQTLNKGYGVAGGFFLGYDGSTNKFSIGDKLKYDGTTFSLPGVTLSSNGTLSDDLGSRGQVTIRGVGYNGDLNATGGNFLNTDPSCTDLTRWNGGTSNFTVETVTDSPAGTKVFRTTATSPAIWSNLTPVDALKTYKVRALVRKSSTSDTSVIYLAVALFDAAGAMISRDGTMWYYPVSGVQPTTGWLEYSGTAGFGTANTIPANAKFIAVGIFLHYGGTVGYHEAQGISLEDITAAAAAQTTANTAATAASTAQSDATSALGKITDISSDNLLTPDEKPQIIQDYDVIIAEKSGINTQASNYGVTTESTAYNTAVTDLTNYLATLTSPVLWSNLTGNTTIVGVTFRTNFKNVYTARQALLDKIAALAKTLADAAQTTANAQSTTTLVGRGVTVNGNTLTKTGGTNNTWDADVYSQDSFVGGAYASVKVTSTTTNIMFGLNSDPTTNTSYSSIDYAIYLNGDGNLYEYNGPTQGQYLGTRVVGDILAVTYDGVAVRYLKNGTVIGTPITVAITGNLFFDSSFYQTGSSLTNVQFGPLTSIGTVTAAAATAQTTATNAASAAATKLNKSAADTLTGPILISTLGGIVSGDLTWNSVGERTGGKGVAITPKGIVGHDGTKTTFVIEATTGNATFSGSLNAASVTGATGTFSGSLNVKSAATGQRTEITDSVIRVYDSANVLRVKIGDLT